MRRRGYWAPVGWGLLSGRAAVQFQVLGVLAKPGRFGCVKSRPWLHLIDAQNVECESDRAECLLFSVFGKCEI